MPAQRGARSQRSSLSATGAAAAEAGDTCALPYPFPSSAAASAVMRANRKTDTGPERALRSALHRLGLRYRVDHRLRLPDRRPIRLDIAFTRAHIAVFVDGCFWHSCPDHGVVPVTNRSYWGPKLERNRQRDDEVDAALSAAGWAPVHVWEHEVPEAAAAAIAELLRDLERLRR